MGFIKMLVVIPVIIVLMVFAFVNNDLATFNLWPFYVEVTVSLSVAILFFVILGFVLGLFYSWLSHAPVRKALRSQKKQNKKLSKEQQKLVKEMGVLQENLETLKELEVKEPKLSFGEKVKGIFSSAKDDSPDNQN